VGKSGTGKTFAAEVLANDLRLDLYRIDLASVISKWVGETEKHLARVFDAAEAGGAVLLFDEADALFGRRSEVRDSHDRYANVEVSYLLQRLESYRGLAILTTNMRAAIDAAFLRRLRFVVEFPYPDAEAREAIWRRVFPRTVPIDGLRFDLLASVDLSGGNIFNVALGASYLAGHADEPVSLGHIYEAARAELVKLRRPISELAAWWEEGSPTRTAQ
jgi:SpoVK/Ycf46/Vps4 family AAA+-type ATPase